MIHYIAQFLSGNQPFQYFVMFFFHYITEEAEHIMKEERAFLELPTGMPDYQSIEEARLKAEEKSS